MKKIILPGLVAGIAMFIVSMAFSWIFNFIFPGLFRPWSDPLMSLYFLYPFVLGLILA